jgi:hypothetical protein
MTNELTGTYVLVHRELEHDPMGKQNEIGVIRQVDAANDDVFVGFDDSSQGLYASDALLVLLPADEIHRHLSELDYDTAFKDIKSLTQIDLFLRYGSGDKQRTALEIAKENRSIQQYCLEPLENRLNLNQSRGYE